MRLLHFLLIGIFIFPTGFRCLAKGKKDIEDSAFTIQSNTPPGQFRPFAQRIIYSANKGQHFDFGIPAEGYCYIVVKAQSIVSAPYVLYVNNTSLDTVLIYSVLSDTGKQLLYKGGNLVSYDEDRQYVWHTAWLNLNQNPSYYLIALKAASQNVNVNYQILKPGALQGWYRTLDRIVYFYAGFVLLISLVCITGGVAFGRKALFIYAGYVLTLAGWILAHYGYLFPEFYPGFPVLNGIIKQVTSLLSTFCLLNLITVSFGAELKRRWSQLFLFLKAFITFLILFYLLYITGIFDPYVPMLINILWNVSLLVSACFIVAALGTLFSTNRTARLFCIAISIVSLK